MDKKRFDLVWKRMLLMRSRPVKQMLLQMVSKEEYFERFVSRVEEWKTLLKTKIYDNNRKTGEFWKRIIMETLPFWCRKTLIV